MYIHITMYHDTLVGSLSEVHLFKNNNLSKLYPYLHVVPCTLTYQQNILTLKHTYILQPSWAEEDQLFIVTEFSCLLGLTVF